MTLVRRASRSDAARTDRIAKTSTLDAVVFVFTIRSARARRPASQADPSNRSLASVQPPLLRVSVVIPFAPSSPLSRPSFGLLCGCVRAVHDRGEPGGRQGAVPRLRSVFDLPLARFARRRECLGLELDRHVALG